MTTEGEAAGGAPGPRSAAERRAAGLCPRDGNPAAPGKVHCRRCSDAGASRARRAYRRNRRDPGRCRRCGKPAAGVDPRFPRADACSLCPPCWFSAAAKAHFGRRGLGRALGELFLAQGGRCALTGRALTLGRDASLDHREPKSRGGALTLANVRWVHWQANMVKGRLRDDELLEECRRILAFAASDDRRRMVRALARATRRLAREGDE